MTSVTELAFDTIQIESIDLSSTVRRNEQTNRVPVLGTTAEAAV